MIEFSGDLVMFHFEVGQGGLTPGTPIDDVITPVDQAFLIEADENFFDRFRETFIHRKPLTAPVAGSPQFLQLADDGSAGLFFPLPNPLNKFLSSKAVSVEPFLQKLLLYNVLSGNARVVRPRHPQDI